MEIGLPIEGATCRLEEEALMVLFNEPVKVLSSAVLNGGLRKTKALINMRVSRDFCDPDPEGFLKKAVHCLGLPKNTVGLMTAADIRNSAIISKTGERVKVSALITAGLSWPIAAGDKNVLIPSSPSTINIILIVDGNLTGGCMVNCLSTATEAKAVALRRLDIRSRFSNTVATGTTTDALALATTGRGEEIRYAGPATELGMMISEVVVRALEDAIRKEEKLTSARPLLKRLEERGITLETLLENALELFAQSSKMGSHRMVEDLLKEGLVRNLSEVNVACFILAALRLQEDRDLGLIPGLTGRGAPEGRVSLMAGESLGKVISNYIAGTEGVRNFLYFRRMKREFLKKIGPFVDAAIGGLIAGTVYQICSSTARSVNEAR